MSLLGKQSTVISIAADASTVISTFLRVYLANERLTDKQLEVTVELVKNYAQYVKDGVKEPYASALLFSTATRKDICSEINISSAHLNNTFNALTDKNILAREDGQYLMNPNIVPAKKLIFEFKVK